MSTKKVKDGIAKQLVNTTRTKRGTETTKKEVPKVRTSTRTLSKKKDEDEEKIKKQVSKPPANQSSVKRVSRPAPTKKSVSTTKPPSSRPVTPPSSRVTKSQYFPSKKMYSNALTIEDKKIKTHKVPSSRSIVQKVASPRITRSTNDISPGSRSIVQKVASPRISTNDTSPDTSSMSERPRTATLRKGSIVNNNIVGPDAPKAKVPLTIKVEEAQEEYEDDFDSYESDFEEYDSSNSIENVSSTTTTSETSESESMELKSAPKRVSSAGTDDEKKLDSGNYELPESRHRQILDNIKESIEKENANLNRDQNRSNLGSLSDEGFEDGKSLQFINFLGAQKKYQHRKSVELRRKRGQEILSMIRLDHYSFTLLDLPPVPYDVFIKNFGKSNTVQASVQTGEDDVNEEVQTDEISCKNKWTQFPPVFDKIEQNDKFWEVYKCNYLGVGGDVVEKEKSESSYNESSFERFLLASGNLILNLQAEANLQISNESSQSSIPFSKGHILYNTQTLDILKSRTINDVCFCANNTNKILTVHGRDSEDAFEKSVVCLWNISNAETPEMLFVVFGEVICCTFSFDCPSLIFGGLDNGTVVIWDTRENSACHKNVYAEQDNFLMRGPTYSTEVGRGHSCRIVSLQSLTNTSTPTSLFAPHKSTEVCSLDEEGDVIIWGVIFKDESRGRIVENQGLAHWGSVIIAINTRISLRKLYPEIDDFNCTDLAVSHFDSSNLYISTSYGIIVHCLTSGGKSGVKKFLPNIDSQANCLEICPFSAEYLISGFDNGHIHFYSRSVEKPLMVLSNKDTLEGRCKIQIIQWSHNRPLIFYTKDVTNTIHVWNLKVSDMFPIYSVPFKENIVTMKLSPVISDNDGAPEKTYMMIATDKGSVYVHLLNDEHDQQSAEAFEADRRKFLNYINRYV